MQPHAPAVLASPRIFSLFAVAVLLTGCSTAGYKKADSTAASLRDAAANVQMESHAFDQTLDRLNVLVNNPASDAKPQFKSFSRALDELISASERVDDSARQIQKKSALYLTAWDQDLATMGYGIIRERSEARKMAVSNQVDTVHRRCTETQAVVRPLIAYFQDIRTALRTDLTMEGLDTMRELVRKTEDNTRKVQIALAQLATELASSGGRISTHVNRDTAGTPITPLTETSRADAVAR